MIRSRPQQPGYVKTPERFVAGMQAGGYTVDDARHPSANLGRRPAAVHGAGAMSPVIRRPLRRCWPASSQPVAGSPPPTMAVEMSGEIRVPETTGPASKVYA
jgi:hypothetical protein